MRCVILKCSGFIQSWEEANSVAAFHFWALSHLSQKATNILRTSFSNSPLRCRQPSSTSETRPEEDTSTPPASSWSTQRSLYPRPPCSAWDFAFPKRHFCPQKGLYHLPRAAHSPCIMLGMAAAHGGLAVAPRARMAQGTGAFPGMLARVLVAQRAGTGHEPALNAFHPS